MHRPAPPPLTLSATNPPCAGNASVIRTRPFPATNGTRTVPSNAPAKSPVGSVRFRPPISDDRATADGCVVVVASALWSEHDSPAGAIAAAVRCIESRRISRYRMRAASSRPVDRPATLLYSTHYPADPPASVSLLPCSRSDGPSTMVESTHLDFRSQRKCRTHGCVTSASARERVDSACRGCGSSGQGALRSSFGPTNRCPSV